MEHPDYIYSTAWTEVYKIFGEHLRQPELDLMDGVLEAVVADDRMKESDARED